MDINTFRWTFLESQSAEKFLGVTIQCFRHNPLSTNFFLKKGISLLCVEIFFVSECWNFCGGTIPCVRKIRVSKNFSAQEGDITSFCWIILETQSAEEIRGGTIHCVRKIRLSKKFIFCIKRRYHCSPLKRLCLIVSTNFAGEPFFVSKKIRHRWFSCEGGEHIVLSKSFFASQDRKI